MVVFQRVCWCVQEDEDGILMEEARPVWYKQPRKLAMMGMFAVALVLLVIGVCVQLMAPLVQVSSGSAWACRLVGAGWLGLSKLYALNLGLRIDPWYRLADPTRRELYPPAPANYSPASRQLLHNERHSAGGHPKANILVFIAPENERQWPCCFGDHSFPWHGS